MSAAAFFVGAASKRGYFRKVAASQGAQLAPGAQTRGGRRIARPWPN